MLFHFGFIALTAYFLLVGFLMFALPGRFIDLLNWYYRLVRRPERTATTAKFSRWWYRASGLGLLMFAVVLAWQYVQIVKKH